MNTKSIAEVKVKNTSYKFHGGIHPAEYKTISNQRPPATFVANDLNLYLPVKQNIGSAPVIEVKQGYPVATGQPLTTMGIGISASIHSPVRAEVIDITRGFCGHPSAMKEPQIHLKINDPEEAKYQLQPSEFQQDALNKLSEFEPIYLLETIEQAGIVGLGGATFPTATKLSAHSIETLIINAMECEPYITCDDVSMRFYGKQILVGACIAAKIVGAKKIVLASEENKLEAIEAMRDAAQLLNIAIPFEIVIAPTKYPSGGEKQTIELVTGKQVPKGKLPSSIGVVVQNVGTLFAIYEAVLEGKPLTKRLVTITGDMVDNPGNYWIMFGTRVDQILKSFVKDSTQEYGVIIGGPLMGNRIRDFSFPVQKSTNCIIVNKTNKQQRPWLTEDHPHRACIRCSECEKVCPVELLPQQLYWFAQSEQWESLEQQDLFDCIECGACSYVCPSDIPLVHYYRYGKSTIRHLAKKKQKSEHAKDRFEFREMRLQREKEERALKHKKAAEARKKAASSADGDGKQAAINAALARVQAKKSNDIESAENSGKE